jgi:membrane associated rhomboid family serine protease
MTKWVRFLLIANVVIYFAQLTMRGFTESFMLVPALALRQPWTVVTYMFLHDPNSWTHIIFNMIGLWWAGTRVESRLGSQRFLVLYFVSGLTAALFAFIFAYNAPVIGASGAIFGLMMAYAYFWPRDKIYLYMLIPIEARVLLIVYTAYSIFGLRSGIGNTAHYAHLGGLVGGFVYLQYLTRYAGARKFRSVATAPKVVPSKPINWQQVDPQKVHEVNRDELNRILDKVSKLGLSSLSPDELRFLMNFVPPDDRPPMVS